MTVYVVVMDHVDGSRRTIVGVFKHEQAARSYISRSQYKHLEQVFAFEVEEASE